MPSKPRARRNKPVTPLAVDRKAVGERIKRARESRDWSKRDLAAAVGTKTNTVANWESGVRLPSFANFLKITVAVRRRIDWLLFSKRALWSLRDQLSAACAVSDSARDKLQTPGGQPAAHATSLESFQ